MVALLFAATLFTACSSNSDQDKQTTREGFINTPPIAQEANLTFKEDTPIAIELNATDADHDSIEYRISKQPEHGKLSGEVPCLTYTPDQDYNGEDQFSFIANDGQNDSAPATITLTITPVNDAPVAQKDLVTFDEDTNVTIRVLDNDTDVDGDTLHIKSYTNPAHGTLTEKDNALIFVPDRDYFGEDGFGYTVTDGNLTSQTYVDLSITPVNDPPVAGELNVTLDENTQISFALTATDVDSQDLSYRIQQSPAHGRVEGTLPDVTYIPDRDYYGADSFTYVALDDQHAESEEVTVHIFVVQIADLVGLDLHVIQTSLNKDSQTSFTITPHYSEGKITQKLRDAVAHPAFVVTPHDALSIHAAAQTITALKDTRVRLQAKAAGILSNTVTMDIYWEVGGYRLPPEPDPKTNNATLLGVDSNGNGVRDDVERFIFATEKGHTNWIITDMQFAKGYQKVLERPEFGTRPHMLKAAACLKYHTDKTTNRPRAGLKLLDAMFNTKARIERYFDYLEDLSGRVLFPPKADGNACETTL